MNRMSIEAMKLALEALEWNLGGEPLPTKELEAMTALRQAIEQIQKQEQFCDNHCTWRDHHSDCVRAEKQEPVAFETWLSRQHGDPEEIGFLQALKISYEAGQDSAPPKREWVDLTLEETFMLESKYSASFRTDHNGALDLISHVEFLLKERNT